MKTKESGMLKVVVFDSGWGGELVADYLIKAIPIIEVERVIDWRNAPYHMRGLWEIYRLMERVLEPYFGKAQVIVLASYTASLVIEELKLRHPEQEFVGMDLSTMNLNDGRLPKKILVVVNNLVRQSLSFEVFCQRWRETELIIVESERWTELIDEGVNMTPILYEEMELYQYDGVETVVIGDTHALDVAENLVEMLGWQSEIRTQLKEVELAVMRVLNFEAEDVVARVARRRNDVRVAREDLWRLELTA